MTLLILSHRFRASFSFLPQLSFRRPFSYTTPALKQKKSSVKNRAQEEPVLLGRPSNNLKIGVVGMPNVGSVPAENYPFCTIDPEEARVEVPDERFDWLCEQYKPKSRIPTFLTVIDIAGLVKGAASGAGLGNAFLANIRAVDAIYHVCRGFTDTDIVHVEGNIDPIRDLEIIHEELRLKDEEFLEKKYEELKRVASRTGAGASEKAKEEFVSMIAFYGGLGFYFILIHTITNVYYLFQVEVINNLLLLTAKPVIYLCNLSEQEYLQPSKNKWVSEIKRWIEKNNTGDILIPFSASFEARLLDMSPSERAAELVRLGGKSALPDIIVAGYKALQLIHYFTVGADEVRGWTIRKHTKAPAAAGVIHTDFQRGFICAEVMPFDELKKHGSEASCKAAGASALDITMAHPNLISHRKAAEGML
ncbi:uncharacterized protein VTP21DRAFT_6966 [Calcarisporiella thermophila]|uniref:uncharacterized protein n=1 Tax=Calcarisporiella thermophila TaxID=911321 RepID=UPI0037447508